MFQSILAAYYKATILQEQVLRPCLAVGHEEGTGSYRLPSLHVFLAIGRDLGPKGPLVKEPHILHRPNHGSHFPTLNVFMEYQSKHLIRMDSEKLT